jgi:predicted N-acyltransferase
VARAVDLGLEQASAWGAEALVIANLTRADVASWSAVRPFGTPVLLDRRFEARLGGSEATFLAGMSGKVRREFVRQWRRAQDRGVTLRVLPGARMLPYLEEFTALAGAAAEKHGVNIYGSDIFRNLMSVPGAVLLVAEHKSRMVGAFYCFLHQRRFSMSSGGIDYAMLPELSTYAFLMYESLRYATAHRAEIIGSGRGNFAYKERHGFRGTDLWSLVFQTSSRPHVIDALERMSKGVQEHIRRNSRLR